MSSTSTPASIANSARSRPRIVAFAALSALFVAAVLWTPNDEGIPLCGFRAATGVSCPGCGMTRALAALAKGKLAASLHFHAFAPLIALAAAAAWIAMGLGLVTNRDLLPGLNGRVLSYALVGFIVVFLAYWLIRLASGSAP